MNYLQALAYIENIQAKLGSDYSLRDVKELARRVGNPERDTAVIHIAGTNGKGSVGNYISNILACSGYTVGRYVSPSVFGYREKVRRVFRKESDCRNRPEEVCSSEKEIAEIITRLKNKCEDMVAEGFGQPTAFELETVMAFLLFQEWQTEVAVVECGLGGRLDATNIVPDPVLCVFTSISLDHMDILGNTVQEIAKEKYGIIQKGTSVVSKRQIACENILEESCRRNCAELTFVEDSTLQKKKMDLHKTTFLYKSKEYSTGQPGVFQLENAALAIEAATVLSRKGFGMVTEKTIREGLGISRWRGRFDLVCEAPFLLADGAHNEEAARKLRLSLEEYFPGERFAFVIGVFRDKEYEKILQCLLPLAERVYAVTAPGTRGLPGEEICRCVRRMAGIPVCDYGTVTDAIHRAMSDNRDGKTVVCGSLSLLNEVYDGFKKFRDI